MWLFNYKGANVKFMKKEILTLAVTNGRERISLILKKSFLLGIVSTTVDVYRCNKETEPLEYITGIFVHLFGKEVFCTTVYSKTVPDFFIKDVKYVISKTYINGL